MAAGGQASTVSEIRHARYCQYRSASARGSTLPSGTLTARPDCPTRPAAIPSGPPGITTYLQNGGTIEHAQQIANHESPRTTKLYDRTNDAISLDEIERILI